MEKTVLERALDLLAWREGVVHELSVWLDQNPDIPSVVRNAVSNEIYENVKSKKVLEDIARGEGYEI